MANADIWSVIHSERAALAADLGAVPDERWATPSLCPGWSVQRMLGHMIATARMTPPKFLGHMIASGFNFNAMTAKDSAKASAGTPQATVAEFAAHAGDTTSPPGPVQSWLGETVVHGTDIRWPLGIEHTFPADALITVADFYKGSNLLIGSKNRIAGLTLTATDAEWSTGAGPQVSGPMHALVMAMTGRAAALDRLAGPGVDTLRGRTA
jgi:uncharacterized protein (TIGR03083 family)